MYALAYAKKGKKSSLPDGNSHSFSRLEGIHYEGSRPAVRGGSSGHGGSGSHWFQEQGGRWDEDRAGWDGDR